ncbi:hypothetical protein Zmor_011692 [Zophobas morio]|uniref:Uncharacterized protein n=1 Tax=Zophobas morio TaxID=2755281 RepID=A0AA38MKM1_9CUCU|nr:hypothetical protein Zmor_011692 [Zophobas morio]
MKKKYKQMRIKKEALGCRELPLNLHINETKTKQNNKIFGMKNKTGIGTWNVRTMLEATQLAQIIHEMDLLNMKMLGLYETRWPGNGKITNRNGSVLLYSGKEESEKRMGGVGILLSLKLERVCYNGISFRTEL